MIDACVRVGEAIMEAILGAWLRMGAILFVGGGALVVLLVWLLGERKG